MIYALRKLIAFVFLGGMFWFIYQDLDNLDKPWFMHALGMIAIAFAFFWLLIPMVVSHPSPPCAESGALQEVARGWRHRQHLRTAGTERQA